MDKETLSNYGWIVICVLVLAVMIALAGPFGNFVADAVKSTTQGLFDTNQKALDAAGIEIMEQGFVNSNANAPFFCEKTYGCVMPIGDYWTLKFHADGCVTIGIYESKGGEEIVYGKSPEAMYRYDGNAIIDLATGEAYAFASNDGSTLDVNGELNEQPHVFTFELVE